MELIQWYLEHSYKWCMGTGMIPSYAPAQNNEELRQSHYWKNVGRHLASMMENGQLYFPIIHPEGAKLEKAITTNIELAVNGEISVQEALDNAEQECNDILE